jgi:putative Holliday junction resolvase
MPDTPESRAPETIIAFDFGRRRIGVAIGQNVTRSATPIGVVSNSDADGRR